ncbi:hypothetical protein [Embleya sp. NBC_00896]|uniref:hypothetical protein n=1 Tax=Embleya sp. NBC_00896 TaxID=2975961 RepID=UPI00386CEB4D|nr:hypothetical protein OG928_17705 [Embleya sp. NBC_00896]
MGNNGHHAGTGRADPGEWSEAEHERARLLVERAASIARRLELLCAAEAAATQRGPGCT